MKRFSIIRMIGTFRAHLICTRCAELFLPSELLSTAATKKVGGRATPAGASTPHGISTPLVAESGRLRLRAQPRALTREQHYASGIPKVEQTAPLRHGATAWA